MKALVVGGGIGGITAALALRKAGIDVEVLERAAAPAEVGAGISIWGNATRALERIDAAAPVLARGEPMRIGEFRTWRGALLSRMDMVQLDRDLGVKSIIIHRAELLDALLAQLPRGTVRFGHEFTGCAGSGDGIVARFATASGEVAAAGDVLIGADGLRSRVREHVVGDAADPLRYSGSTCWRGVADWPESDAVPAGYVAETWGRGARFGIVRMTKGRVYWFATKDAKAMPPGFVDRDPHAALAKTFGRFWGPIPALIGATPRERIVRHDLLDREPRRGWSRGPVVLLGDAAHPTTPNVGQGGCLAIEDAIVLARCLLREATPAVAFSAYEAERFERCAEITRFSWRLGAVGQMKNALLRGVRDFALRYLPEKQVQERHRRYVGFDVGPLRA